MKHFDFLWKRADLPKWNKRKVLAANAEDAIENMRSHLARRADFPDNVVVDHLFYERIAGDVVAHHTLTKHANPFPIMFGNNVYASLFYKK